MLFGKQKHSGNSNHAFLPGVYLSCQSVCVEILFIVCLKAITKCPPVYINLLAPSPACVCRFAFESGGWWGPEHSATWTRLMSLSRHTDLCCNTHGRHHKLSHQFSPIGCGMSWLTQFVEKCTCLCLPSLQIQSRGEREGGKDATEERRKGE